jgi:feruloyl esterase
MQHCAGTPADVGAPWYFAGPNQAANLGTSAYSVPGYQDAAHDELLALIAWVEEDKAPETLIATEWKDQDVKNGVRRQRPLCKWPEQARFTNEGSPDDAKNWKCENIHGEHQPGYAQEEQVVGNSY